MATAGSKRYRITIQRLKTDAEEVTRQASGHIDMSVAANWTTHATRWASIRGTGGREWQQAGQVKSEATHFVVVDFDSDTRQITSDMRVSWSDNGTTRILDITRVVDTEQKAGSRRREVELECKEHS